MSNSSSNGSFAKVFFIALATILFMAICEIGPFKKRSITTSEKSDIYNPQTGTGYSRTISFGHRPTSTFRRFEGHSRGGSYHCTITIYDSDPNTAYINNYEQGTQIYKAQNYDDPGPFFCYWGSVAIYF